MPNHPLFSTSKVFSRRVGALVGASLVLAGLSPAVSAVASTSTPAATGVTAAAVAVAAAQPTRTQASRYGAGWLATQIEVNGGHLEAFGFDDPSDTAYAVVGLHATRVGRTASDQAIAYLKTQLTDALQASDGSDDPGRLGYWIMAAVAAGQDPRHFGGHAPTNNLVARLLATARTGGPDKGLFGSADPTFDGAFRQGTALAGLKAAHVSRSNAKVASALAWLTKQQCGNGLWVSHRASTTTACPAADPDTFAGPDTNSTSMAVQGLAAYGRHPHASTTLSSLRRIQSADGGFPFLAAKGQGSDPDSTALAIQAILADGGHPAASSWQVAGVTPYAALVGFQLGCSDPAADRGAFFFPGDRSPSTLATVQAVVALAGKTFPLGRSTPSTTVPVQHCASAASSVATTQGAAAARSVVTTTLAGKAGPCKGTAGVTVAVDFKAFGGTTTIRCAPGTPATGVAALQQAGFTLTGTAQYGLAFVCRINGFPTAAVQACRQTPPVSAYWAYYHANKGATAWTTSTLGASSYKPQQGSIEAWAFGASAKPSKTPAQVRAAK